MNLKYGDTVFRMKTITYYKDTTFLTQRQINSSNGSSTLLDLINEHGITGFDAPCGGNGTCGKCRVRIIDGTVTEPAENELALLTERELAAGIRLACSCRPLSDITIDTFASRGDSAVISSTSVSVAATTPATPRCIKVAAHSLPEASILDQRSIFSRIISQDDHRMYHMDPHLLRELDTLDTEDALVIRDHDIYRRIPAGERICGIAVDIGTTTLVLYLVDLEDGRTLDVYSALNAQKSFGADVISRIAYATESQEHRDRLQQVIVQQIQKGIEQLLGTHHLGSPSLMHITIAGNTTMLHLLTGAETAGIAASPFIPVFTEALSCEASRLGFTGLDDVTVELLPSVAAYVGADITAGIHTCAIHTSPQPSILLDIGTNGEMALSVDSRILCCSTAAGPAFEGANIACGTGGIHGAIDSVNITPEGLTYTTIADEPAIGICGSGIIDALAGLLEQGLVDYTGRLLGPDESDHPAIREQDGNPVLLLAAGGQHGVQDDIYLTQKDIREVQLAKSAIAAGLLTLMGDALLTTDDISQLYLAGGFGSFIHPESAGIIGLIPRRLIDRTIAVGNSSGEGAVRCCFGSEHLQDTLHIAERCEYIELSGHKQFQDLYIQEMMFELEE
jgi:uncharacterized 2Fe-2S/4Fe-4S cluster protein (DUF4445 family)